MAGLFAHGVGLTLVLCDALCVGMSGEFSLDGVLLTVNLCDDIEPDRCGQHGGERERAGGL